jgi:pyruvate,water dikinase
VGNRRKLLRGHYNVTGKRTFKPNLQSTIHEGKKVLAVMAEAGLERGKDGLQVYVMCEIPANVILGEEFCKIFDGFSIGSNDLTQLTLGLDRDSELIAHVGNERNEAVKKLIVQIIEIGKRKHRKVGICGQAPSDFPDFVDFLVRAGIDSISLTPDTVAATTQAVADLEKKLKFGFRLR